MYIDYKKTTWERISIPDECNHTKEEIIDLVKTNQHGNAWLWDELDPEPTMENIFETDEYMTLEDNQGQNTIEIFDDECNLIWGNGDKQ